MQLRFTVILLALAILFAGCQHTTRKSSVKNKNSKKAVEKIEVDSIITGDDQVIQYKRSPSNDTTKKLDSLDKKKDKKVLSPNDTLKYESNEKEQHVIIVVNKKPCLESNMDTPCARRTFKLALIIRRSKILSGEHDTIQFSKDTFKFKTAFNRTLFTSETNFLYTEFLDNVDFAESIFNGRVLFTNASFHKKCNFTRVQFKGVLRFDFVHFDKKTQFSFYQAKLPNLIDISYNPSITQKLDFSTANFNRIDSVESSKQWYYINLYSTDISKIKIDYEHFRLCFYKGYQPEPNITYSKTLNRVQIGDDNVNPDSLWYNNTFINYVERVFPQSGFARNDNFFSFLPRYFNVNRDTAIKIFVGECLRKGMFPRSLSKEEMISIYEKQLKSFLNEGQKSSYEKLDIEYHIFLGKWGFLPHWWNCYGHHKEWVIYWTLLFMVIFTITTYCFLPYLVNTYIMPDLNSDPAVVPPTIQNTQANAPNQLPFLKKAIYAFVFTASIFFPLSFEFEKFRIRNLSSFYICIVYIAGLFCVGYLAAFVLQK